MSSNLARWAMVVSLAGCVVANAKADPQESVTAVKILDLDGDTSRQTLGRP